MTKKPTREQLGVKDGDTIIIKGTVSFAKLDKLVDGEDLVKENQRRMSRGMVVTKAFRSVSIENPTVVRGENTPLANFYGGSVYTPKKSGIPTMTIETKSLYPPAYGHLQNGVFVEIQDPQKNPATGQVIYLMINAFSTKGFSNMSSSFNTIVFEEGDIEFYEGGSTNSLAGFGEAMNMPVQLLSSQQAQTEQPTQGFGQQAQTEQPTQGFGQQAQTEQPTQGFGQQAQTEQQAQPNNPFGGQNQAFGQQAPTQEQPSNPFNPKGTPDGSPYA